MGAGLEQICTVQVDLAPAVQDVGPGPMGHRRVLEIVGGTVEGERLNGEVLPGGADWLLLNSDGWGRLDVRMQWRLEGGAVIYVSGQGVVEFSERLVAAIGTGEGTEFGDQYYRGLMRMEAGDQRYAWVNRAVFIAECRISPGSTGHGIGARLLQVT